LLLSSLVLLAPLTATAEELPAEIRRDMTSLPLKLPAGKEHLRVGGVMYDTQTLARVEVSFPKSADVRTVLKICSLATGPVGKGLAKKPFTKEVEIDLKPGKYRLGFNSGDRWWTAALEVLPAEAFGHIYRNMTTPTLPTNVDAGRNRFVLRGITLEGKISHVEVRPVGRRAFEIQAFATGKTPNAPANFEKSFELDLEAGTYTLTFNSGIGAWSHTVRVRPRTTGGITGSLTPEGEALSKIHAAASGLVVVSSEEHPFSDFRYKGDETPTPEGVRKQLQIAGFSTSIPQSLRSVFGGLLEISSHDDTVDVQKKVTALVKAFKENLTEVQTFNITSREDPHYHRIVILGKAANGRWVGLETTWVN
jgi:hypothetical protein